jgi:hypothetical protein
MRGVAFSMAGYSANEIEWFGGIEDQYYDDDTTMVVLYADALAHFSSSERHRILMCVLDYI